MLKHGCLATLTIVLFAGSWSVFRFLIPRAWQKGGLPQLAPVSYIAFALGLVVLVIAVPRRFRLAAALALALSIALFISLWPAWEANTFPTSVALARLVAAAKPDGIGCLRLCVYDSTGPVWVDDPRSGAPTPPVEGKISGFYADCTTTMRASSSPSLSAPCPGGSSAAGSRPCWLGRDAGGEGAHEPHGRTARHRESYRQRSLTGLPIYGRMYMGTEAD